VKERGSRRGVAGELKRTPVGPTIRRLKAAAADMGQAARGAALLAASANDKRRGRMNPEAKTALAAGVVLAYARPFTRRDEDGALNMDAWTPADRAQARLHATLISSRNERYRSARPAASNGSSSSASGWLPPVNTARSWLRVSELAEAQRKRMRVLASGLEDELEAATPGSLGKASGRPRSALSRPK
jgi:hypothetical protein